MNIEWLKTALDAIGVTKKLNDVEPLVQKHFITPEMFGAVGDGVKDDTDAFLKAFSYSYPTRLYLKPSATYLCGDVHVPSKSSIEGICGRGYTLNENDTPQLKMKPGASCVLNVNNTRGVRIRGVLIDGVDKSAPCISAGSVRLNVSESRLINGLYGIGGSVNGGSSYSRVLRVDDCVIASNDTGVSNLIDSWIVNTEIANNGRNLRGQAGANSNFFIGVRLEWPTTGENIRFTGDVDALVSDNNFIGCQLDRGWLASIYLDYSRNIIFSGGFIRRSNRSLSTDAKDNCLITIQRSKAITFSNIAYGRGHDDSGGDVVTDSPDYVVNFEPGCDLITFEGGAIDISEFISFARSDSNCTNLRLTVSGAPRIINVLGEIQESDGLVYRGKLRQSIPSSSSSLFELPTQLTVPEYNGRALIGRAHARNATSGADYVANFILYLQREAGNVSASGLTIVQQTTAGFFGIGSGTIQLSISSVTANGSHLTIQALNGAANTIQLYLQLDV